jgi:hypothetical protein
MLNTITRVQASSSIHSGANPAVCDSCATAVGVPVTSRALPIGGLGYYAGTYLGRCSGNYIHSFCQDISGNHRQDEVYQGLVVRFLAESHLHTFSC